MSDDCVSRWSFLELKTPGTCQSLIDFLHGKVDNSMGTVCTPHVDLDRRSSDSIILIGEQICQHVNACAELRALGHLDQIDIFAKKLSTETFDPLFKWWDLRLTDDRFSGEGNLPIIFAFHLREVL